MDDPATEITIKPATKQTVEIIVNELCENEVCEKAFTLWMFLPYLTSQTMWNLFM